jgi:hypothetical protein
MDGMGMGLTWTNADVETEVFRETRNTATGDGRAPHSNQSGLTPTATILYSTEHAGSLPQICKKR